MTHGVIGYEGTYWCNLTVKDNGGLTATDEVTIRVVAADCPYLPYSCDAFGNPCDPWDINVDQYLELN